MEEYKDIYKVGKILQYGFYTNVRYLRTELIAGTKYAVLLDNSGNEKKVYSDLFEKYAKVMPDE